MAKERMGGFPKPPFEDELRGIEAQINKILTTEGASTQWGMVAGKHDWVEASRTFPLRPLGPSSQQELRVVQQLGPHPTEVDGAIYSVAAYGGTMTWPAGTEDRQKIECSGGRHPADIVENLLALLVDVTDSQSPSKVS